MSLEERIAATNAFDPARFVDFRHDDRIIGHVRRDLVPHLERFPDVFALRECIAFDARLADCAARTAALAKVARDLSARGVLSPWRNETYAIVAPAADEPVCHLERAAVRFFGFTAHAIHVNGITDAGASMWIAQRSLDKAIDPGLLDTLVGGGIASGLSVQQTLIKEAWEEAGIAAELARSAVAAGLLPVCREVPEGLHVEVIHVFDLMLPSAFEPCNRDGEVARFRRLGLAAVARELAGEAAYTVDAARVAIDWLVRRGVIEPHPISSRD